MPVWQWVISVPKRLRGFLADRPPAVAARTPIFLGEIEQLTVGLEWSNPIRLEARWKLMRGKDLTDLHETTAFRGRFGLVP